MKEQNRNICRCGFEPPDKALELMYICGNDAQGNIRFFRTIPLNQVRTARIVLSMHTVVETPTFNKAADRVGLKEADVTAVIEMLARHPEAGEIIQGSGGCRKVRVAGRGKGKSGGFRVITYFGGNDIPVFLLTVFSKGEMGNLSDEQVNAMKVFIKNTIKR